jgi:hypothetical protein
MERKKARRSVATEWQRSEVYALAVRLYALVGACDPEAIGVYLCEQDAQRALEAVSGMSRIAGLLEVRTASHARSFKGRARGSSDD